MEEIMQEIPVSVSFMSGINAGQPPKEVASVAEAMQQKLKELILNKKDEQRPTITRVYPSIRNEDPVSYDPQFITIGPLHRIEEEDPRPRKHLKWRYLHDLLQRDPYFIYFLSSEQLQKYVAAVEDRQAEARSHYSEEMNLEPNAFVEMLVLDGCFIVEFLIKRALGENLAPLSNIKWNLSLLENDLFLLENQIPFFILKNLFSIPTITSLHPQGEPPITLIDLALHLIGHKNKNGLKLDHVHHLLHLKHICFLNGLSQELRCNKPGNINGSATSKTALSGSASSASKLRESGVSFKKKKEACILNVSFRNGKIEMPSFFVYDITISIFRNFIAFEQSCPDVGNYFTSYALFLDSIIDTAEDVVILQDSGIIKSTLGSAKELADIFNGLGKRVFKDNSDNYLDRLVQDVRNYSKVCYRTYWAKLVHDHFSAPWSMVSPMAAVFLILMSACQCIISIYNLADKISRHGK